MYYEEAIVREYERPYKNKKVPYYQINIGRKTGFKKEEEVVIIRYEEFKELEAKLNPEYTEELEAKVNVISDEKGQLEEDLQEAKKEHELLTANVNKLTDEIARLQQELLTEKAKYEKLIEETNSKIDVANANVIEAKDKIERLQMEHKEELGVKLAEIKELNIKLNNEKDISKALLVAINDLNKRNFIARLFNKEPSSVKQVLELKPKELLVKDISEE